MTHKFIRNLISAWAGMDNGSRISLTVPSQYTIWSLEHMPLQRAPWQSPSMRQAF